MTKVRTIRLRQHRGLLEDSLKTTILIPATYTEVLKQINKELEPLTGKVFTREQLSIKLYGYDDRCGWNSHIITLDGWGVYGFCDAMPEEE